ncbi:MAG: hypothetical protein EOL97_14415 [Spirochaetia bacterium]|nr:hypothetical protein [Spirochaetia bacterium]
MFNIIKENRKLKELLKININNLKELDRSKIYFIKVKNKNEYDIVKSSLNELNKKMLLPEIIITTEEIKESEING